MKDINFLELAAQVGDTSKPTGVLPSKPYTGAEFFDSSVVFQMNWSVYFIMAVSIASIAWGLVNFFMVNSIDMNDHKPIL
jgi:hypothetical protein